MAIDTIQLLDQLSRQNEGAGLAPKDAGRLAALTILRISEGCDLTVRELLEKTAREVERDFLLQNKS